MERINEEFVQRMISHINKKEWWHVPPRDREGIGSEGSFFFRE